MTAADTDRSVQLVLEQGHGTPIWTAARQHGGSELGSDQSYNKLLCSRQAAQQS